MDEVLLVAKAVIVGVMTAAAVWLWFSDPAGVWRRPRKKG
jgi:hypothetical protein